VWNNNQTTLLRATTEHQVETAHTTLFTANQLSTGKTTVTKCRCSRPHSAPRAVYHPWVQRGSTKERTQRYGWVFLPLRTRRPSTRSLKRKTFQLLRGNTSKRRSPLTRSSLWVTQELRNNQCQCLVSLLFLRHLSAFIQVNEDLQSLHPFITQTSFASSSRLVCFSLFFLFCESSSWTGKKI